MPQKKQIVSIGMIENSWNYYMYYLNKVKSLGESSIGETIYHEMEEIHYRMPMGFRPKEAFVSRTQLKDVPKDVRLIFEWDNSEAEFELEFVNPQGQAYSFIHTYEYNDDQINDEKKRGYSCSWIRNLLRRIRECENAFLSTLPGILLCCPLRIMIRGN